MARRILQKSPESVKNIGRWVRNNIIPFPYGYGLLSVRFYNWLMKTQWFTLEELEEVQNERLRMVIRHAYQKVPYYRRIFDERNLKPTDVQSKEDLELLPILTKNDVRQHFCELIAKDSESYKPTLQHTSGSTGQPLNYYIDATLSKLIAATVWRHWRWCGIEHGEPIAVFRGTLIDDFGNKRRSYFRTIGNETHFSTFEMNKETMAMYIEKLNKIKPSLVVGYPASLEVLAEFMNETSLSLRHRPKAIHTSSEVVLPEQREIIGNAFDAPLFDWYGQGESTVCAGECECHRGLHLNLEFGCTEFTKTEESEDQRNVYNVVSTSLWNFSMPFIRYDTEDLALIENTKCKCGRGLPLVQKIIGRQADIIEGVNGVKTSPSSLVHFWKYKVAPKLSAVEYAQIVQEKTDSLLVRLVGQEDKENEEVIRVQLNTLLGNMKIEFEYLSRIPTGQKWRFTVSKLDRSRRAS